MNYKDGVYCDTKIGDEDFLFSLELITETSEMSAQHGSLSEFNLEDNRITLYLEGASLHFTVNDVAREKQVAILLSSISPSTYALLSDLFVPEKPSSETFKQISEALKNHYEPQCVIIAEWLHFYKRDHTAGELIAEFDAALRKLSPHCNFGTMMQPLLARLWLYNFRSIVVLNVQNK